MFQIVLFIYNDNSLNMKLRICTLIAVSCAALSGTAQNEKLTEYVNPLVGTDGYGNVYPGAQIPFGGIQISPDTDAKYYDAAAGYKYNHTSILGFSLTHLSGTGIPDLGDFLLSFPIHARRGTGYSELLCRPLARLRREGGDDGRGTEWHVPFYLSRIGKIIYHD